MTNGYMTQTRSSCPGPLDRLCRPAGKVAGHPRLAVVAARGWPGLGPGHDALHLGHTRKPPLTDLEYISNENFGFGPIVCAGIGIYGHLWTFDDLVKFQFGAFERIFVRGNHKQIHVVNSWGGAREPRSPINVCDRPPDASPARLSGGKAAKLPQSTRRSRSGFGYGYSVSSVVDLVNNLDAPPLCRLAD